MYVYVHIANVQQSRILYSIFANVVSSVRIRTTSRLLAFAMIKPNMSKYTTGAFSNSAKCDFLTITYAAQQIMASGTVGNSTLVSATVEPFLPTPPFTKMTTQLRNHI
jgi:hypothetical protein